MDQHRNKETVSLSLSKAGFPECKIYFKIYRLRQAQTDIKII